MKQFLVPDGCARQPLFRVEGENYHYLKDVRRCRVGDAFVGTDGQGVHFDLTVLRDDHQSLLIKARQVAMHPRNAARLRITLYQCLLKGRKMDQVIRQSTEAGVDRIVPLIGTHVVAKLSAETVQKRRERWLRVAREALQQSDCSYLPHIDLPLPFQRAVDTGFEGVGLFFHEQRLEGPTLHCLLADDPAAVSILVGPEGGLSAAEVAALFAAGFSRVSLGDTVLRAETAALAAIAAVRVVLRERNSWQPVA